MEQSSVGIPEKRKFSWGSSKKYVYIAVFIVYIVLTFIGAMNHEVWFDEAQAWNISRDNDVIGIFKTMKYEGHPALWHLLLYPFTHSGCPVEVLPFISWFFSVITVGLILWKSPLHPAMNIILVFSNGFLYANSVISRVYCIMQLMLVVFAILYPSRKQHPVLYGLCIAVLTNTHICIWGFIAAIGIYMFVELLIDFKKNTKKQNLLNIAGLLIAAAGVLVLILQLLGSVSNNTSVTAYASVITFKSILSGIVSYMFDIMYLYITYDQSLYKSYFLCVFLGIAIWLIPILLRHNKKACIILSSFIAGYFVTCELLWFSIVNRSAVFILVIVTVLWIMKNEGDIKEIEKPVDLRFSSKMLKKLCESVIKCDRKWFASCCVITAVLAASSIPTAVRWLIKDYTSLFVPNKAIADYIKENVDEDALLFVEEDGDSAIISAYLPEYKFYSLKYLRYCTYKSNTEPENSEYDYDLIEKVMSSYDKVYYITGYHNIDRLLKKEKVLYSCPGGPLFKSEFLDWTLCIKEFDFEDFKHDKEVDEEFSLDNVIIVE